MPNIRAITFFILVLISVGAFSAKADETSDPAHQAVAETQARDEAPPTTIVISQDEGYSEPGSWHRDQVDGKLKVTYQYKGTDNRLFPTKGVNVALENGEFSNGDNTVVEYKKGDIVFKDAAGRKYKARPSKFYSQEEGYCATGNWNDEDGKFQYPSNAKGLLNAPASIIANEGGFYLNEKDEIVLYQKGDVLFQSQQGLWCKSLPPVEAAPTDYFKFMVGKNGGKAHFSFRGHNYEAPFEVAHHSGEFRNKDGVLVSFNANDVIIHSPEFGALKVRPNQVYSVPHEPARGIIAQNFLKVLKFARGIIGRKKGSGYCDDLTGTGGQEIGRISNGTFTGTIAAGAVLTRESPYPHWMLVESYDPTKKTITVLQQNVSGSPVRRDIINVSTGIFSIRAPTRDQTTAGRKLTFLSPGL